MSKNKNTRLQDCVLKKDFILFIFCCLSELQSPNKASGTGHKTHRTFFQQHNK